jgi:hypothetical protein
LPEETVVALRIPNGSEFAKALVTNTKLGAEMLSDKKQAAITEILELMGEEEWSEFQTKLEEFGLTTDDLKQFLAGETGYAVVVDAEDKESVFVAGLAWCEPGEELAGKTLKIIAKAIESGEDDEHPVTRIDLEIAGQKVMQLKVPEVDTEYTEELEFGDDHHNLSEAEQEEAWERAWKKYQESAVEVVSYQTVLITQLGGRLLLAHTFETEEETSERLSATFGRLITLHRSGNGAFVSRLQSDSTVARTMSLEGVPVFELLVDVSGLIELASSSADSKEASEKALRMIGTKGLGPLACRSTLQGTEWHTVYSLAVASPRQGFMRLLNQEALPSEPPSWVPASAVRYAQMSFDLSKLYAVIKEEVRREFPEQFDMMLQQANTSMQGFAQASLEEVAGSLGNRHTMVSYGFESGATDAEELGTERTAFVWQVSNEALWTRLLKALQPFAAMTDGLELTDELGYRGWRLKSDEHEGGLMLGNGNLVFAMGAESLETTLASLNNPPKGRDSLRGSEIFAAAAELVDLGSAHGVEITDGSRYMAMLWSMMGEALDLEEEMLFDEDSEESNELKALKKLRQLMPSKEEVKEMMGISASALHIDDDGIRATSVMVLPAP